MSKTRGEITDAWFVMVDEEEEISKPACIARLYLTAMVVGALFLYGLDKYGIREEAMGLTLRAPAPAVSRTARIVHQLEKLEHSMK